MGHKTHLVPELAFRKDYLLKRPKVMLQTPKIVHNSNNAPKVTMPFIFRLILIGVKTFLELSHSYPLQL